MKFIKYFALIPILFMLGGCPSFPSKPYNAVPLEPVLEEVSKATKAEGPEQLAYTLYGAFVVAEERGAAMIGDPDIPNHIKVKIRMIDAKAKLHADRMMESAQAVIILRSKLLGGEVTDEQVQEALVEMVRWSADLRPMIQDLLNLSNKVN